MNGKRLIVGEYRTNCYIVWADCGTDCVVVDPGDNGGEITEEIKALGLTPAAIFVTHGHFDHFLAVPALQRTWEGLPVYCSGTDCANSEPQELYEGVSYPTLFAMAEKRFIHEGDRVAAAGLTFQILETPGHSPGSVSMICGDAQFTGDTLYRGSIGCTDYPGGCMPDMIQSLKKLALLPGDYRVYPGHDEETTLARERHSNPFLHWALGMK